MLYKKYYQVWRKNSMKKKFPKLKLLCKSVWWCSVLIFLEFSNLKITLICSFLISKMISTFPKINSRPILVKPLSISPWWNKIKSTLNSKLFSQLWLPNIFTKNSMFHLLLSINSFSKKLMKWLRKMNKMKKISIIIWNSFSILILLKSSLKKISFWWINNSNKWCNNNRILLNRDFSNLLKCPTNYQEWQIQCLEWIHFQVWVD